MADSKERHEQRHLNAEQGFSQFSKPLHTHTFNNLANQYEAKGIKNSVDVFIQVHHKFKVLAIISLKKKRKIDS